MPRSPWNPHFLHFIYLNFLLYKQELLTDLYYIFSAKARKLGAHIIITQNEVGLNHFSKYSPRNLLSNAFIQLTLLILLLIMLLFKSLYSDSPLDQKKKWFEWYEMKLFYDSDSLNFCGPCQRIFKFDFLLVYNHCL